MHPLFTPDGNIGYIGLIVYQRLLPAYIPAVGKFTINVQKITPGIKEGTEKASNFCIEKLKAVKLKEILT
jgi:hypothetical protein